MGIVTGLSAGTAAGGAGKGEVVALGIALLVFLLFRTGAVFTSAGDGPASAGFATSVPTATGATGTARLTLLLAIAFAGVKLHGCAAVSTDVKVNLSPDFLPRNETIEGAAVTFSPI